MDSDERRLALIQAVEHHKHAHATGEEVVETAEKFLAFLTGSTAVPRPAPSRRAAKASRAPSR